MPTTQRRGFNDSLVDSKLNWLLGTAFPAAPASLFISLLRGTPLGDGSDAAGLEMVRTGPVTFSAPQTVVGNPQVPTCRFVQPNADVSFTIAGVPGPGVCRDGPAWALYGVSSGGVPLYVASYAWRLLLGTATTIPASVFRVFASEQS